MVNDSRLKDLTLPTAKSGYFDVRAERGMTETYEIKDRKIQNYLKVKRDGRIFRVAGEKGFLCSRKLDEYPMRTTEFSHFVKRVFEGQQNDSISAMPDEPNRYDMTSLREILNHESSNELTFSCVVEDRWIEWKNSTGLYRMRRECRNVVKAYLIKKLPGRSVVLRRFFHSPSPKEVLDEVARLRATADILSKAKRVRPGSYDVVLHPTVGGVLIHELFGHYSEMDTWGPFRKPTFGIQVSTPHLTVEDIPDDRTSGNYIPFDDEGVPSKRATLIQNGIFKEGLHSLESAFRTNCEPNGRGRARDFSFAPRSRMSNIRVTSGSHHPNELLSLVPHGLFLIGSMGGIFSLGGDFQICCQYGYLIKNGKITDPVIAPVMGGGTFDVLGKIAQLGNDSRWVSDGGCLSEEQFLYGSGRGAPHMLLQGVNVY